MEDTSLKMLILRAVELGKITPEKANEFTESYAKEGSVEKNLIIASLVRVILKMIEDAVREHTQKVCQKDIDAIKKELIYPKRALSINVTQAKIFYKQVEALTSIEGFVLKDILLLNFTKEELTHE